MTLVADRPKTRPTRHGHRFALLIVAVLVGALNAASGPPFDLGLPHGPGAVATHPKVSEACGGEQQLKADGTPWRCTWSDEFNGDKLSKSWSLIPYGLGSSCIYNDSQHVQVSGGTLRLVAFPLPPGDECHKRWGLGYGGGGIQTSESFSQEYGRFEMRAKLPAGAGFWPAFWLVPADESYSGEIDVMEAYGGRGNTVDATLHRPAAGPGPQETCAVTPDYSSDFHDYRLEWSPGQMRVLYDSKVCASFSGLSDAGTSPPPLSDAFAQPYYVLLDLVVQPFYPPDASTRFPGAMEVDWVRVWS